MFSFKCFFRYLWVFSLCFMTILVSFGMSQDYGVPGVQDSQNILSHKERVRVMNDWLKWRLEHIVPDLMKREGIDMWLICSREYAEDPVFMSFLPQPMMASPGLAVILFNDLGNEGGFERLSCSPHGIGGRRAGWYQEIWTSRKRTQFQSLSDFIKKRNPKKIGINVSKRWAFGDGLTASLKEDLEKALGSELSSRFVSAENLCVGWLETRSPDELSAYRYICGIPHDIISEFFSNKVIIPDITTTDDVVWWIRQKFSDLGLNTWFQPSISLQRQKKKSNEKKDEKKIIRRGDLLHCDIGIRYLGLCTDMQWQAYVCKIGENDAPEGLKKALRRANRVAEILMAEFKEGRSGRDIAMAALKRAEGEGLRSMIYSHPVGIHGHAAGCYIDTRLAERTDERNPLRWDYPLYPNTVYAIELSSTTKIPEWGGQDVRIGFEETAVFTEKGCRFLDGHQIKFLLIK